ncbi:MAG: metallophosphoesterase [Candidatus Omnitrophica bacterium]|nr:metallophosphoesterase [Candidatus Omnitrophota bacterium]
MKKIIHMSDLHIGYKDFKYRFMSIIHDLRSKVPSGPSQYIIVITGDLVNDANKKGSCGDALRGLNRLKRSGFKHILVVPGNHDYGTGNKGNKKFVASFKKTFYRSDLEYPKLDIINRIAFIGLDSMAEELHWYDDLWAQGELGKKQLDRLEEILNLKKVQRCNKRVVYLHHHPFKWRPLHQLKDAGKLKKVLTKAMQKGISIDAILFGHNHEGDAHNGTWGIPRCYDAGTATLKPRSKYVSWATWFKVQSSTRVIDLNQDPAKDYRVTYTYQEKLQEEP